MLTAFLSRVSSRVPSPCALTVCPSVGRPTVCVAATNQILHPCILAQIFNGYSPETPVTFKDHMLFYKSVDSIGGENMAQLYFNDFPDIGTALNKLFQDYPKELMKGVNFYDEQKYEVATTLVLSLPKWFRSMAWFAVSHFTGQAIKTNQRLAYVKAPMKEVKGADGGVEYVVKLHAHGPRSGIEVVSIAI